MSNGVNFKDLCIDLRSQLNRVTAERDALRVALGQSGEVKNELQQRLTAADERADVLEGLLRASRKTQQRLVETAGEFCHRNGISFGHFGAAARNVKAIDAALNPTTEGASQ